MAEPLLVAGQVAGTQGSLCAVLLGLRVRHVFKVGGAPETLSGLPLVGQGLYPQDREQERREGVVSGTLGPLSQERRRVCSGRPGGPSHLHPGAKRCHSKGAATLIPQFSFVSLR